MLLESERELVADYSRRMVRDGLALGTAGNVSVRAGDLIAITPSGVDAGELTPSLVCVLRPDGKQLASDAAPSTETPLHLAVYDASPAGAVVHAHPPFATAVACVLDELPAVHYLVAELGGPVPVAPYSTPGSDELAAAVVGALEGRAAVLLRSHGSLTVGDTLELAYRRSLLLEWLAALHCRAQALGEPALLGERELDRLRMLMRRYRA